MAQTDARNHVNGRAGTKKHGLKELMNRPYLNQITKIPKGKDPLFFNLNPLPPKQPKRSRAIATPFSIKVSEDSKVLYFTAASSDHFVAIDSEDGSILDQIKVGSVPRGIAIERKQSAEQKAAHNLLFELGVSHDNKTH